MNYRHHFHAGNAADVLKHLVALCVLRHLERKPAGYCYLETHAGRGLYDLASDPAQRSGEHREGIGRIWGASGLEPEVADYVAQVRVWNQGPRGEAAALRFYPGSPCLAHGILRAQDRMVLCELHPEEHRALRRELSGDRRVAIHRTDGYMALRAFLPPKERLGLCLIDPPYERPDELDAALAALREAHGRFPSGILAVWYPIKAAAPVRAFHAGVAAARIPRALAVELCPYPDDRPERLSGSGVLLVNPPFQLDATLRRVLPTLVPYLDFHEAGAPGRWRVEWLTGEEPAKAPR